jgi:hypothetical protein
MRNDTVLMDRIHAYLPGLDIPKVSRDLFTDHFGLVSDVLAECFTDWAAVSEFLTKLRPPRFAKASASPSRTFTHERATWSATETRANTSSWFSYDPSTRVRAGRISASPC